MASLPPLDSDDRIYLGQFMVDHFSLEELANLVVFDLDQNWDDVPHDRISDAVRHLVSFYKRREELDCLIRAILRHHPSEQLARMCTNLPPCRDRSSLNAPQYFETANLASPAVWQAMTRAGNHGVFAVDDGIVLYRPANRLALDLDQIHIVPPDKSGFPLELADGTDGRPRNLSADTLRQWALWLDAPAIHDHLSARIPDTPHGYFQTKVSLALLTPYLARFGRPLTLKLRPLSYWTLQEFNRAILLEPDNRPLQALREDCLSHIFRASQDLHFRCPSALYVELALVTSDHKLVAAEKSPALSDLAKAGYPYTLTFEEGLSWKRVAPEGHLDFTATTRRGAWKELGIPDDHITHLEFYGIALEATHLNTALFGSAQVTMTFDELRPRFDASEDFESATPIDISALDPALHQLFIDPVYPNGRWHPTARLRGLFTLYRRFGRDQTLSALQRLLEDRPSWRCRVR